MINLKKNIIFIVALGCYLAISPLAVYSNNRLNLNNCQMIKEKKCTVCGKIKSFSEFYITNNKTLKSECKLCTVKRTQAYKKTINGRITDMYGQNKRKSRLRNHNEPSYSNIQLNKWVKKQIIFYVIYDKWVDSGYSTMLVPSIDRLDDYKGYSLDNIQITTWEYNNNKGKRDIKNGINNKKSKAVLQYTKDDIFIKEYYSIAQASRETNIFSQSIVPVCKGRNKIGGGYKWRYKNV